RLETYLTLFPSTNMHILIDTHQGPLQGHNTARQLPILQFRQLGPKFPVYSRIFFAIVFTLLAFLPMGSARQRQRDPTVAGLMCLYPAMFVRREPSPTNLITQRA